jgi:hypothetical protein
MGNATFVRVRTIQCDVSFRRKRRIGKSGVRFPSPCQPFKLNVPTALLTVDVTLDLFLLQSPDINQDVLDLRVGQLTIKGGHLVLAVFDDGRHLGIGQLRYIGRLVRNYSHSLADTRIAETIFAVAHRTLRLKRVGAGPLGEAELRGC